MAWSGVAQSGSREFDPHQRADVLKELLSGRYAGRRNLVRVEDFAGIVGLSGRTVRAILADIDGRECVLALGDEGLCVAECYEETEPWTRTLRARARNESERALRRERLARTLPRQQGAFAL